MKRAATLAQRGSKIEDMNQLAPIYREHIDAAYQSANIKPGDWRDKKQYEDFVKNPF